MKNKKEKTSSGSQINLTVGGNAVGNAIGNGATVKANIISNGNVNQDTQIAKLFEHVFAAINARPVDQTVDKEEIVEVVQGLSNEADKGDQADENIIKRRLRSISRMAPDILEVIIETFKSPTAGIVAVIQKIALKVKQEAEI